MEEIAPDSVEKHVFFTPKINSLFYKPIPKISFTENISLYGEDNIRPFTPNKLINEDLWL